MRSITVLDLGKAVKDAVKKQGMLPWQYNTIGVSDAITMGGEGTMASSWLIANYAHGSSFRHAFLPPNT